MKVLIVEDEPLSAEHLIRTLNKVDKNIQVIKTLDSISNTVKFLSQESELDLIFLDIHIADGNSFEIFSKITIDVPIIFTTAFNEYAIKAFKLNSIDYLLKPIGIDDLTNAIAKYNKLKNSNQKTVHTEKIENAISILTKNYKSRFLVKLGETISSIKVEDISFFIAEDGITLLVNKEGKRFPVDYSMDALELLISPDVFFRINRKVLVHIDRILQVHTYFNSRLKLAIKSLREDDAIVSRERVSDFKLWLDR
ncbi:MAG: LytR/AlgR family response regulator transcription factor [Bacteroidota bacterium]|jgi:DNA-binding LytR/AlgR family response regulator